MRTLGVAFMLLLAMASTAYGQDKARLAESDKHYEEGSRLYHAGDYAAAVLELKSGYELAPHPIFLVNIALAYSKLENWSEAATWGRRAATEPGLPAEPNAQTAARAEAWSLAGSSESMAALVAAAAVAKADDQNQVEIVAPPAPAPSRPLGGLAWTGIAVGSAGVLAIGGAGVVGALLQDDRRAFETAAADGNAADYEKYKKRIDDSQTVGKILLFGGAGLVAVGGVLFLVDRMTVEAQMAITPAGASAGLALTW